MEQTVYSLRPVAIAFHLWGMAMHAGRGWAGDVEHGLMFAFHALFFACHVFLRRSPS